MNLSTQFTVLQWLDQLDRLRRDARCSCPTFLRPYHFASLALTLAQGRAVALQVPQPLVQYAARMQLWHAIGLEPPVATNLYVPDEGRALPLVRIDDRNLIPETAASLADITARYGADDETREAVRTSMMEILENCFAHAEVDGALKGVACAQSWPGANLAQIAIADCGIGIRRSLLANEALRPILEEGNSCEIATRLGVTSKPERGHAGYGLALTRQLLEHAGGRLIVVSGTEWMQARGQRLSTGTTDIGWNGTLAVLEWRTNVPLRLKDVYSSWPLPTGFDHDDFEF